MLEMFNRWYRQRFSDPHAVTLCFILLALSLAIYFFADILMPLLVAIVTAYILEWPVAALERLKVPRTLALVGVLLLSAGLMVLVFFGILPSLWQQTVKFTAELPHMLSQTQAYLMALPDQYPQYINAQQIESLTSSIKEHLIEGGQELVSLSFKSIVSIVALMIYVVLVPLLVFFFLKDKALLVNAAKRFIPSNRKLATQVWQEMNGQILNYIRGKIVEIIIVGGVSYIAFTILGLHYSMLLAVTVGLSVLIPFIGAAVVTIPVLLVGVFQWGLSPEFTYLVIVYGVIQALDGNLLVPLLFSEAVNLHPTSIIVAVLLFGGLWGFWGIFFAIPLATLVKAVINAMSKQPAPQ